MDKTTNQANHRDPENVHSDFSDFSDDEYNTSEDMVSRDFLINRSNERRGWKGYIGICLAFLASLQMALTLLIAKNLNKYHPFMISFWKSQGMLLISPVFLYLIVVRKKNLFSDLWPLSKAGNRQSAVVMLMRCVSSACVRILQIYSIHYISVADSATITSSTPVFVTLASHAFLGEKSGVVPVICGIVTMIGVIFVTRPPLLATTLHYYATSHTEYNLDTLFGSSMAVGCMICLVISFTALRGLKNVHFTVTILCTGIWGSVQSGVMSAAISRFELPHNEHDWILVGALVFLSFTSQICATMAFQYEEAGTVALCRTSDVVFAFMWQYLLTGLLPDRISLIGSSIVFFGVLLASIRKYLMELPVENESRRFLFFMLK